IFLRGKGAGPPYCPAAPSLPVFMNRPTLRVALLSLLVPLLAAAAPKPSPTRGESVFRIRCALCHTVEAGAGGGQGPNLRGVVGRKASSTDFAYSPALRRWGRVWTPDLLGKYLRFPSKLVPGTTMVQQVPDSRERADLIAYLATLKASETPPPAAPDAGVAE